MTVADIERIPAQATVERLGVDAIWIAPTAEGARLRASLCLTAGCTPAEVLDALTRWEWSR